MQTLRELSETTREGSNLFTLSEAAEKIGFRTLGVKLALEKIQMKSSKQYPMISNV
jgi:ATP-binding cassette, subfamily B, bacterial